MGCIYKFENTVNGKVYIGQSKSYRVERRRREHITLIGKATALSNAIRKYGKEMFVFEVIEDGILDIFLNDKEQYWVAKYDSMAPNGYNLTSGGDANYIVSEETRQKMSEAQSGENHPMYGRTHKEETLQKMSEAQSGENHPMYGRTHKEETLQKMSEAQSGENHHMYGKTHKEETIQKISGENHHMYGRTGENHPMYGRTHKEETIQKMSKAKIGRNYGRTGENSHMYGRTGENHPMYGRTHKEESKEKNRQSQIDYHIAKHYIMDLSNKHRVKAKSGHQYLVDYTDNGVNHRPKTQRYKVVLTHMEDKSEILLEKKDLRSLEKSLRAILEDPHQDSPPY